MASTRRKRGDCQGSRASSRQRISPPGDSVSAIRDEEVLASHKVRFVGDAIAAVAAKREEIAAAALDLIECEIEELPAALTADNALQESASLMHDNLEQYQLNPVMARKWNPVAGTNIAHQTSFSWGDVERGFADADEIFVDTFRTKQVHPLRSRVSRRAGPDLGFTLHSLNGCPIAYLCLTYSPIAERGGLNRPSGIQKIDGAANV
jgi:CO/xanthine dehydrogenase Mo-binding subunit